MMVIMCRSFGNVAPQIRCPLLIFVATSLDILERSVGFYVKKTLSGILKHSEPSAR